MAAGDHGARTLGRYSEAQARLEHAGGYAWRERAAAVLRGLGFADPDLDWHLCDPPIFDNQVGTFEAQGRRAWVRFEYTKPQDGLHPALHLSGSRRLA